MFANEQFILYKQTAQLVSCFGRQIRLPATFFEVRESQDRVMGQENRNQNQKQSCVQNAYILHHAPKQEWYFL